MKLAIHMGSGAKIYITKFQAFRSFGGKDETTA
jgi:hypothetical protein